MFLRLTLAGASALVLNASLAQAEEARILDPVEVTGLRAVEIDRVTSSVSVLTEEDLAVRLSPNPADQLRAVPGVAVSRSGSIGGLTQVRMRGAEANHTLVLFDGIEVSDPVNGETDFGLLTALPVGGIEVLRGAASSIHGSDAIGGVVSLSAARDAGLTASAEAGSFGTARGNLGWSGEQFGAAISGFTTDGVDSSGNGGEKDGSEALSGLLTGKFDIAPDWSLSLIGLARKSESDFDSDTDFDGLLNDTDNRTEADQWLAGASLTGSYGAIDHVIRASYNEVDRDNFSGGAKTDDAKGQRAKFAWSPRFTSGVHTLTGLLDYEREKYDRTDVQYAGATDASETFETVGLAAEYRLAAGAFDFSASARFDDNDGRFDDATTWRLGAGYAFDQVGGRVRASVGTGIKNPTFTEMFGFFPGSFVGNPDLKPEESTSWEIGWEQTVGAFSYSATYFDADLTNEIYTAFNPDFTSTALNRATDSERSGVELAARWQALANLAFSGQATFFDSQDNTGVDEIRIPEATASLAADWLVNPNGFRLGAALDYVGEQGDTDFGPFPARAVSLDAYTLASITAEYPITDRIAVTLRGENVFDETATDVYGYHAPGAGVFVGLKLR
ncbi:TonB-dependent receptor [Hyphomonas sp. WL0036]|uniref:TonB-dependent receptor plug domain-containing protein n=1 Tax=Hyphomonas sediminis TaxID=2866160 RepID=UPI001C827578|nr:TonB-dependent receptor [Hyphomonas sediminis]MBY9066984.1 TonB-dependent receptor [Hyphomonas sediminis]